MQTCLALAIGLGLSAVAGPTRPNEVMARVLLAMALVHVALGVGLGLWLSSRAGRGAALAAAVAAAVALSVPAWFAALMLASNTTIGYLVAAFATLALAYVAGFALTRRCARAALRPLPDGHAPAATADGCAEDARAVP